MICRYCVVARVGVGDAVVVEHQLRVGEVLLRQAEGVEDPVPAGAVGAVGAAERPRVVAAGVAVVALVGGVRAVGRIVQRLVDDLEPLDVRVALRDRREPLLDLHQLLLGRQRGHPRRLLVAPDEHVEVEREAVGLREGVRLVEVRPAHRRGPRRSGRAAPLARVLGRDLVEVLREQRARELVDASRATCPSRRSGSRGWADARPGQRRACQRDHGPHARESCAGWRTRYVTSPRLDCRNAAVAPGRWAVERTVNTSANRPVSEAKLG